MNEKEMKIWKDAFKWNYEAYPFFCSVYQKGAIPPRKKYFVGWEDFLNNFQGDHLYAFKPRARFIKAGNIEIKELLSGNDDFLKIFREVHREVKVAIEKCLKVRKNKEIEKLENWWQPTQKALSDVGQMLFCFDYTLDGYLNNLQKKSPDDFSRLSEFITAEKPSFIDKANSRLIDLNKLYPNNFDKVYEIFISEFGWFQNSYRGTFKISKKWLGSYFLEIKNAKKHEKKMGNNLPEKYRLLARTARLGINFRDDKKELLLIAVELMEIWIRNICRKNNWKFEVMRWLTMDEMLELLQGRKENLERARKYAEQESRLGMLTPIGYEKVKKDFWDRVYALNAGNNKTKEIKGVGATKGIYSGVVKIITNIKKEGNKLKAGEILVTSMTRPEYLLLMKKAGAFITDEGGITSHAAIVSRELGKPCIIGTKIATKVLKDGDLVEVDANKGIVKILKNNKLL